MSTTNKISAGELTEPANRRKFLSCPSTAPAMRNRAFLPATFLLMAAGISSAFADTVTLPGPQFNWAAVGVDSTGGKNTLPGSYIGRPCLGSICAIDSVSLAYNNGKHKGFVTVTGDSPSPLVVAGASGDLAFFFGAFGPFEGSDVHLKIGFSLVARASASLPLGGAAASAFMTINHNLEVDEVCAEEGEPFPGASPCEGEPESVDKVINVAIPPNQLNNIFLYTACDASSGSCAATADPTIDFDPAFDHTGLTLVFSPVPPSAVPEPRSFTLAGLGVAILLWNRLRAARAVIRKQ